MGDYWFCFVALHFNWVLNRCQLNLQNPDFMTWTIDAGRDRLNHTVYQHDFCEEVMNKRLLTGRKVLDKQVPVESTSMYRFNFSHNEPTKETLHEIQSENQSRFSTKNRAKSCMVSREHSNVASCLVWNNSVTFTPKTTRLTQTPSTTNLASHQSTTTVSTVQPQSNDTTPAETTNVKSDS